MALGEITLADIILTIISIILGGNIIWLFYKKVTNNKNTLKDNQSGGDIAGGNIVKTKQEKTSHSTNCNTLSNNIATGDIAGGDIEK